LPLAEYQAVNITGCGMVCRYAYTGSLRAVQSTKRFSQVGKHNGRHFLKTFMRAFAKIAKSNSYLCHVCPPVYPSEWNNSVPTGRIFIKFRILGFFENPFKKLKLD
jgi:hypothetical protein